MSRILITTARFLDRTLTRIKPRHLALVGMSVAACTAIWMVQGLRGGEAKPGDVTASIDAAPTQLGESGFPIPRFVSLKANKVNVRKGPSSDHAVAWVFQRKGLPVEVIAESDNWRKIRDAEGQEGWILQQMLSGRRFALAPNWLKQGKLALYESEASNSYKVALLSPGVLTQVETCNGDWCYVTVDDYEGYVKQTEVWGVYPGEVVD
jgi:SH3-like domain-containing protein